MRLQISAIGKMKAGPEQQLFKRYLERATKTGSQLGITGIRLVELPESRADEIQLRKTQEAESLIKSIPENYTIIAFDENGTDMPSVEFANILARHKDNSTAGIVYLLGGADGHGKLILSRAAKTIRLGRMTWPHQIARILLMEQIYRAMTIISRHPYHRQ